MFRLLTACCVVASLVVGCGGGDAGSAVQSSAALTSALGSAAPGDTIHLAAGTFVGSFSLPAGVTLVGSGPATVLQNTATDGPTLVVVASAGAPPTTVDHLNVVSNATAAIATGGGGEADINNVQVDATRGIGIGAQDLAVLKMSNVTLTGPVMPSIATSVLASPTPDMTATHGIILLRVASATLSNVQASGFELFGAQIIDSTTTWDGGGTSDNAGVGVMIYGGTAMLHSLVACRTLAGTRLQPAYGAVFAQSAVVNTDAIQVCDGDDYGILEASGATGSQVDSTVTGNSMAGVWVQSVADVHLTGAGTTLDNNGFSGVVAVDSSNVSVEDATISNTQLVPRVLGSSGTVQVGDGVELVRSTDGISLANLMIQNNQRAGALMDLNGGDTSGITLDSVTVTSDDAMGTPEYGVVAQNGTLAPGWDTGVTRTGTAVANDAHFVSASLMLDVANVVAPSDIPMAANLESMGLTAVGVVTPSD